MAKKCPICSKPIQKENAPFCSKRCADVDLGNWFQGNYVINGTEIPDEEDVAEAIQQGNISGDLPNS